MKRISVLLIIGFVLVACGEQTEPLMPLDKGAPNTVTLSNDEVVYKLDGEWSGVFNSSRHTKEEDIIKISQDGNTFVGVYKTGHKYMSEGEGAIKGELEKNGFKSVYVNAGPVTEEGTATERWEPATGKISENCNKIKANAKVEGINVKLTLNRK